MTSSVLLGCRRPSVLLATATLLSAAWLSVPRVQAAEPPSAAQILSAIKEAVADRAPEPRPADATKPDKPSETPQPAMVEPAAPKPADAPEPAEPSKQAPSDPAPAPVPEEAPAATAEEAPAEPKTPQREESVKLRFNFRYQPWDDVLDWFAEQAGLSLVPETMPQGTFNYVDDREYTPTEAIDLLNKVLLIKGFVLVRSDRMLMLINLEDGIPPNLVTTIPMEELDHRGEYELVAVLFQLVKLDPEEAEQEIEKLLGPQGSVVTLPKSQQILVTETAGRLRTIRRMIQAIEDPQGLSSGQLRIFEIEHITPDEVLAVVRQLLDIPADQSATADGSLRFALTGFGTRIVATGKPDMLARMSEIIDTVDVADAYGVDSAGIDQALQLEIYPIRTADPEAALKVVSTLMAGVPDVRLELEPNTKALIAFGRPNDHATIRATLDQLESDARQIEVIQLHVLDPQLAVLSINKMLGIGDEKNTAGPTIDADPNSRQLIVRGTVGQIAQIHDLLDKLGETDAVEQGGGGNVRVLPLSSQAAHAALEQVRQIWPAMRRNRIREVTPSAVVPTMRLNRAGEPPAAGAAEIDPFFEWLDGNPSPPAPSPPASGPPTSSTPSAKPPAAAEPAPVPPADKPPAKPAPESPSPTPQTSTPSPPVPTPAEDKSALRRAVWPSVTVWLVADAKDQATRSAEPDEPAAEPTPEPASVHGADIIISIGPGGLVIASQDLEALDDFENLVNSVTSGTFSTAPELTIFYLKYAKAAPVAQTLDQILGGGTLATSSSGGGGFAQDMADAALGDLGGGILGSLMGLGGGGSSISPTGSIQITPETRLNALIVEANTTDLETVRQLLEILDQMESPEEVMAVAKPRLIPVFNTRAEEIAEIVKQMYQDRMITGGGGQGARQPSPQEFLEALRGGRGRPSRGGSTTEEVQKMSIGVDPLSNSLVVSAPEPLFQEVKQLVETLDQVATESNQTIQTIPLHRTNPETMQKALAALMGDSIQFGSSGRSSDRSRSQPSSRSRPGSSGRAPGSSTYNPDDLRRRIEFMRAMQSRFGGRGGPGGSSARGRPGGGTSPRPIATPGGGRPSGGRSR